ncbi:MAG TPA: hypothetical protein VE732_08415 [Nitrososphaera sp.]|nr:hypothetical protein [Nitrososphaera sp.]
MKIIFCALALMSFISLPPEVGAMGSKANAIVFEGTIMQIGPPDTVSEAVFTGYRLAKYRVERVCKGKYKKAEIIVDHFVLTGKELNGLSVGDKVYVTVKKMKKIDRNNAVGIREVTDVVDVFYVGVEVSRISPESCAR